MTNNLYSLLRKVFLGSLAGLAASSSSNASTNAVVLKEDDGENRVEASFSKKIDLRPKLLLKKSSNDEWSFMAHRSHRSHSSHRSHYSHYSSYSGGSPGGSSSGSGGYTSPNPGLQPNYNSSSTLQFGARTLKLGMSGTDVTELVNILLRKKYLKLDDGSTTVTGTYNYDETVQDAVSQFQKDNNLPGDGVCGPSTVYFLKK